MTNCRNTQTSRTTQTSSVFTPAISSTHFVASSMTIEPFQNIVQDMSGFKNRFGHLEMILVAQFSKNNIEVGDNG